jgi:hypothetical protein
MQGQPAGFHAFVLSATRNEAINLAPSIRKRPRRDLNPCYRRESSLVHCPRVSTAYGHVAFSVVGFPPASALRGRSPVPWWSEWWSKSSTTIRAFKDRSARASTPNFLTARSSALGGGTWRRQAAQRPRESSTNSATRSIGSTKRTRRCASGCRAEPRAIASWYPLPRSSSALVRDGRHRTATARRPLPSQSHFPLLKPMTSGRFGLCGRANRRAAKGERRVQTG